MILANRYKKTSEKTGSFARIIILKEINLSLALSRTL